MKARNAVAATAMLSAVLCGCPKPPQKPDITCLLPNPAQLRKLDRVVMAELEPIDTPVHYSRQVSIELYKSLQSRRLFHVDLLERSRPLWRDLPLRGGEGLTISEMSSIRKALNCDGIILGQVRNFRPYPHMQVGLFVRMIDLRSGRCLWAVDHVWETSDKDTEKRIQCYFDHRMRSGYEPMDWQVAMLSPKIFIRFVTYEVASTLPRAATKSAEK